MAMLTEQVLCADTMRSGAELNSAIQAIDGTMWEYPELVDAEWDCALTAGHAGSHVAHAQTTPEDEEWWLRWGDGVIRLVSEPICEPDEDYDYPEVLVDEADQDETFCLLPAGHGSPHTDGKMHWSGQHPARDRWDRRLSR